MNDVSKAEITECPIAVQARVRPDAPAVSIDGRDISYVEWNQLISTLAVTLKYESGDRVCFQPTNTLDFLTLYWALFRRQAIACPISTRLSRDQAKSWAKRVGGQWLSADELAGVEPNTASQAAFPLMPRQLATIIFSSGSSGVPKAIVHDLRAHLCSAEGSNANIRLDPDDRWLLSLPTYHVGGLSILFRCAVAGACVAIPNSEASLLTSISQCRATHVSFVATQLKRLIEAKADPTALKAVLLGGSAVPAHLVAAACDAGFPVYTTYGMTEMASQVTTTGRLAAETATSGRPLKHREVQLSEDGEILVRGATLCRGYWKDGELRQVVDENGWFATRDAGRWGPDGCLIVSGRMDNMFISGGENVYPEEIEKCLLELEGVQQAVVIAVADDEYGQRPVAVVDCAQEKIETVREQMLERLPKFKVPDLILPWPVELASTGIKPNRQALRDYVESQL